MPRPGIIGGGVLGGGPGAFEGAQLKGQIRGVDAGQCAYDVGGVRVQLAVAPEHHLAHQVVAAGGGGQVFRGGVCGQRDSRPVEFGRVDGQPEHELDFVVEHFRFRQGAEPQASGVHQPFHPAPRGPFAAVDTLGDVPVGHPSGLTQQSHDPYVGLVERCGCLFVPQPALERPGSRLPAERLCGGLVQQAGVPVGCRGERVQYGQALRVDDLGQRAQSRLQDPVHVLVARDDHLGHAVGAARHRGDESHLRVSRERRGGTGRGAGAAFVAHLNGNAQTAPQDVDEPHDTHETGFLELRGPAHDRPRFRTYVPGDLVPGGPPVQLEGGGDRTVERCDAFGWLHAPQTDGPFQSKSRVKMSFTVTQKSIRPFAVIERTLAVRCPACGEALPGGRGPCAMPRSGAWPIPGTRHVFSGRRDAFRSTGYLGETYRCRHFRSGDGRRATDAAPAPEATGGGRPPVADRRWPVAGGREDHRVLFPTGDGFR